MTVIRLVALPTSASLSAAHDSPVDSVRELVFVELIDTATGLSGWGECSALNEPGYTAEFARGAYQQLANQEPQLGPMASAAVEMARLDLELRRRGVSLATQVGATKTTVSASGTVGLGTRAETNAAAQILVDNGYRNIKFKIVPGQGDLLPVTELRRMGVTVAVDANGSFATEDRQELDGLVDAGVSLIEQPFAAAGGAPIAGATTVADESARPLDPAALSQSFDAVSVKPPCVGGLRVAFDDIRRAVNGGLGVGIGGMVESGLGRASLTAMAALDAVTLPGDISPAARWLADDPWPDLQMIDGEVLVPDEPGIAAEPDREKLDFYTVESVTI